MSLIFNLSASSTFMAMSWARSITFYQTNRMSKLVSPSSRLHYHQSWPELQAAWENLKLIQQNDLTMTTEPKRQILDQPTRCDFYHEDRTWQAGRCHWVLVSCQSHTRQLGPCPQSDLSIGPAFWRYIRILAIGNIHISIFAHWHIGKWKYWDFVIFGIWDIGILQYWNVDIFG